MCWRSGGDSISLDGMATLGHVRGTRDEVVGGTESELVPTEP